MAACGIWMLQLPCDMDYGRRVNVLTSYTYTQTGLLPDFSTFGVQRRFYWDYIIYSVKTVQESYQSAVCSSERKKKHTSSVSRARQILPLKNHILPFQRLNKYQRVSHTFTTHVHTITT